MKVSYLGQGFQGTTDNAAGNHLIDFLSREDFETFTGISAFVSESAVYGLSKHIEKAKQNYNRLNLIVGVDLNGTSKEALEGILYLDIDSYIFYQQESPIFHPKLYLFEGVDQIKLIIGSSNLTRGGLFTNVESSVLFEFDRGDNAGMALLAELKSYHKSLFDFSDPNLFKITPHVINEFYSRGIIPDEVIRSNIYAKTIKARGTLPKDSSSISVIAIPTRSTARVPDSFPSMPKHAQVASPISAAITARQTPPIVAPAQTQRVLAWQKPALSRSDAQIVPAGTAITANLKLSQARFKVNNVVIDQTIYFRHDIFNHLKWVHTKPNSSSYEEAQCLFDITILDKPLGKFTLKLSHDSVRIAGQGNTPTWLHWGNAVIALLQQNDITGKTLNLYQEGQSFSIEIV